MSELLRTRSTADVTEAQALPVVSVIMPVRNEVAFIEESLQSVLAQQYPPERLQVLIVDGCSDDGTREIVENIVQEAAADARLLTNAVAVTPHALNIGLAEADGDVILRVDGHCRIEPDYVRRCIQILQKTGADCVGGPLVTVGRTRVARAIARAQSSPFGVGNAAFRTGLETGRFVDTLAFGAYRSSVFHRIGNFDTELIRNQDDEFNFRLIQSGGKIWMDPTIRSVYYSRANLCGLWSQYFEYGMYKVRVMQKRGGVASWRHLVPAAFVLALLGSTFLSLITGHAAWILIPVIPYVIANVAASVWQARSEPALWPLLMVSFVILHLSYGIGFFWGWWRWRHSN